MARSAQLQKQWELFDQQEYQRAFDEVQALHGQLQGSDLRDAQRLLGLCCYYQQQYSQAVLWFQKACYGSDEANDWLHLALAATMHGDIELGAQAFEQVRVLQQASKYSLQPSFYLQLYWYAQALCDVGQWERLQTVLDELARVYRRLYSTDTAFLYSHGMPFLSSVLALATHAFSAQEEYAKGVAWLQALGEGLDAEGQRQVSAAMQELRQADVRR